MEIRIEIKYPGRGRGPLKPLLPLSSIKNAIDWLNMVDERVINAPEDSPWELLHKQRNIKDQQSNQKVKT